MNLLFMANNGLPRNGLVALYDMGKQIALDNTGQTLVDFSGRGNSAQLGSTAGADTNDPKYNGNGLVFDGNDDYCVLPQGACSVGNNPFTLIMVTSNIPKIATRQQVIGWGYNGSGTNPNIQVIENMDVVRFSFYGAGYDFDLTGVPEAYGSCIIGFRYKDKKGTGNVNLKRLDFTTPADINAAANTNRWLGSAIGASAYLNGSINLVAIYNRALSDAEYLRAYKYLKSLMNSRGVTI